MSRNGFGVDNMSPISAAARPITSATAAML